MPKLNLSDVGNLGNTTTAASIINTNSSAIETALENTLSLDGTIPNAMQADLDMNSNNILNLPYPGSGTEPLRLMDAPALAPSWYVQPVAPDTNVLGGSLWVDSSSEDYDVYRLTDEVWVYTGVSIRGVEGPAGAGTGDVIGPASATDNGVARWDTTTGKLLQNSTVTLSDAGTLGALAGLLFANGGAVRGPTVAGQTYHLGAWDVDGAATTNFISLTANNTPTCDLSDSVTKAGNYIYRAGGTDVPLTDGGTGASDAAGAKVNLSLNNVDNTSDATKNAATATLTNKTLTAPVINGTVTGTYTLGGTPTFPASVVTLTGTQTLTNKTLTTPAITSPTGLVKADVGLGNVDNTSDANKPVSTAQQTALNLKANLASPTFTGIPAAPTAAANNNSTQLATTAYVDTADALKANLASPTFTGVPAAPTAAAATSTTQLATTAFVTTADNLKANLASPTFTGTPSAPTATAGTNTTQLATTAFVTTAVGNASIRYDVAQSLTLVQKAQAQANIGLFDLYVTPEAYGAKGDFGTTNTDDTAAFTSASTFLSGTFKGGMIKLRHDKQYLIDNNLTLGSGVWIEGALGMPAQGALLDGGSALRLNTTKSITIGSSGGLRGLAVLNKGITSYPRQDTSANYIADATANLALFAGTGVILSGVDIGIENVFVGGFSQCFDGNGCHRLRMTHVMFDGLSGVKLANMLDVSRLYDVHGFPLLTSGLASTTAQQALWTRSGIGFDLSGVNDGLTLTACFTFCYSQGFTNNGGQSVIFTDCWADYFATLLATTTIGFHVTGGSTLTQLNGCRASSVGRGFIANTSEKITSIGWKSWACAASHVEHIDGYLTLISPDMDLYGQSGSVTGLIVTSGIEGLRIVSPTFKDFATALNIDGAVRSKVEFLGIPHWINCSDVIKPGLVYTQGDAALSVDSLTRQIQTTAAFTAARAFTLPAAGSVARGTTIEIADTAGAVSSSNTLTLSRSGSDTINGATSFVLNRAYSRVSAVSDGSATWTVELVNASQMPAFTGDVTTSAGAVATTIANNTVSNAKLRDSAALSVIGRSANSSGDPADIASSVDGHVLRQSGTAIGFGTVATAGITDDAVTNAKLNNMATYTVKANNTGSTADPSDVAISDLFSVVGQIAFPATQNPSSNANTLDDYEEGTWTPAITFATPGNLSVTYDGSLAGIYTKIGRVVTAAFSILTTAFTHTTASGALTITGLPFVSTDISSGLGIGQRFGASEWGGITKAGYTQMTLTAQSGGTTAVLTASGSGVAVSSVASTDCPTGGTMRLRGAGIYST